MHRDAMDFAPDPLQARLRVLADPSRFRILQRLRGGVQPVGALAVAVGLSQSCTTRHVQALERARLVTRSPRGRLVEVALTADALALLTALTGGSAMGGADAHFEAPRAAAPLPAHAPRARAPRRAATRRDASRGRPEPATTRTRAPDPDTPIVSPPATAPPAASPALRSRIEEFLL